MDRIERDVRVLKIYAGLMTIVCAALFTALFLGMKSKKFEEIDVERINIIESDGKLRMVIANKARQHPGIVDGITYEERRGLRPPGLMFFNERGDELGGLVFDGNAEQGQGGSLTFDKFRGDQTIQFVHEENTDGTYFAGVKMNDQNLPINDLIARQREIAKLPTKEAREAAFQALRDQGLLMTERLRIGKDAEKASVVRMRDARGKVRLELKVEAGGNPRINFMDEAGRVVHSLPEAPRPTAPGPR